MASEPDFASLLAEEWCVRWEDVAEVSVHQAIESAVRLALKRAAEVAETARLKGQCNDLEVAYNQGVSNAITAIRALGGV